MRSAACLLRLVAVAPSLPFLWRVSARRRTTFAAVHGLRGGGTGGGLSVYPGDGWARRRRMIVRGRRSVAAVEAVLAGAAICCVSLRWSLVAIMSSGSPAFMARRCEPSGPWRSRLGGDTASCCG